MTSLWRVLPGILILVPIAVLLLIGAAIALRSGVAELKSGTDYLKLVSNLSQMILRIAGYVAFLLAVQQLIGLRPSFGW
ncbi:MAG: hypothetical protein U0790_20970 [Isosphaeraceae bacterium]